jgi:hypothetical protein
MKDTCEKCFKDVEVDAEGRCPICGQNIAKTKTERPPEWSAPESGFDPFTRKLPLFVLALIIGVLGALHFAGRHRGKEAAPLYPGDQKIEDADGTYKIVYGPNHPGEVSGLVFDSDLYAAFTAANVSAGASAAAPIDTTEPDPAASTQEEREMEKTDKDAETAVLKNYGLAEAKVKVVREDGTEAEAETDAVGRFKLNIPPGKYQVTISRQGYGPYEGKPEEVAFEQNDSGITRGRVSLPVYYSNSFLFLGVKKALGP